VNDKLPTTLVTGSGNMTGMNIIRALKMSDRLINIVGCDTTLVESNISNTLGIHNYIVPRAREATYISSIVDIIKEHNVRAIITSNDHEVRALSDNITVLQDLGVALNGYSPLTHTFLDKLKTSMLFSEHGIKTPPVVHNEGSWMYAGQQVIRKRLVGSGQKFTYIVKSLDEMDNVPRSVWKQDHIITQYVDGREYTVDMLCVPGELVMSAVIRWRRSVIYGTVHFGEVVQDKSILENIIGLSTQIPSLSGINCVQCIVTNDGECFFTEINPRPGTGIDLTVNAGVNMPVLWLQHISGESPKIPDPDYGLKMTRCYSGHYFK